MLLFSDGDTLTSGDYLKADRSKYRELRNLLNVAQASLRKLVETTESLSDKALQQTNAASWEDLQVACQSALKNQSRDIEIFCWWLTALAYKRSDLSLLEQGLDDFVFAVTSLGDTIHPQLPEKKLANYDGNQVQTKQCENQTRPLEQLIGDNPNSGLLSIPLMAFPFLDDYALRNYLSDKKSGNTDSVKAEFTASALSRYDELKERYDRILAIDSKIAVIQQCINDYRFEVSKEAAIGDKLQPLGFSFVRDNLKQIKSMYLYFCPKLETVEEPDSQESLEPATQNVANDQTSLEQHQPTRTSAPSVTTQQATAVETSSRAYTREDALADLNRIAVFFKKTEPHNPIPYLLARAIKWGNMSFSELMTELVSKDSPVLAEISKLTGVDSDINTLLNNDVALPTAEVEQPKPAAQAQAPVEAKEASTPQVSPAEPTQTSQPTSESQSGSLW
ncbi:type VI secretion system protein TssA [Thalassotalea montiporae]